MKPLAVTLLKCYKIIVILILVGDVYAKNITTGTINVNTANIYQMSLLPGIGKATARKIIASRTHKMFTRKTELLERKLVRPAYFEKLSKFIVLTGRHRYSDPNVKNKIKNEKRKTNLRRRYTINKSVQINDFKEFTLLTDASLFKQLIKEISQAKSEIWLATFIFKRGLKPQNRINQIIKLLQKRAREGVTINVLLEQSEYHRELSRNNHNLARQLRRNNIQVFFDSMDNTMHSKFIIIDRKKIFLGSHNMTNSALGRNHEVSISVNSPELATELVAYLQAIVLEK